MEKIAHLKFLEPRDVANGAATGYMTESILLGTKAQVLEQVSGDRILVKSSYLRPNKPDVFEWSVMSRSAAQQFLPFDAIQAMVRKQLRDLGWDVSNDLVPLASKQIQTIAGRSDVLVYMYQSGRLDVHHRLGGVFFSEGRDVLTSCSELIPTMVTTEGLSEYVTRFSDNAIRRIRECKFVKLRRIYHVDA